jgi:prepilin-type N-terminal cleavage/methylation domain-containing protein
MTLLPSKNHKAFSLIELSIALTIISILIGSILVGKKIRDNTMLHSIMNDMNKLSFAYSGFKSIYLQAPGDFDNATNQLTSTAVTVANGNNNGYIDNSSSENSLSLQHLALSGYIQGSFCGSWTTSSSCLTYMPSRVAKGGDGYYFASTSSAAGGTFSVFDNNATNSSYDNIIVYAKLSTSTSSYTWLTNTTNSVLTPLEMHNIDNKYDDGNPTTGNIIAASGTDVASGCVVSAAYVNSNITGCYFAIILNN